MRDKGIPNPVQFRRMLGEKGLKATPQRLAVHEAMIALGHASAEDVSGLWTLKGGDIVVRDLVTGDDWTPARLKAAYAECVTVLGVTDNRRAPNAPHWRVTGT